MSLLPSHKAECEVQGCVAFFSNTVASAVVPGQICCHFAQLNKEVDL